MNQKDVVSCDFICEWFDFLRTWISNESDNHDENRNSEGKCLPGYENINESEKENVTAQPKTTNVTCCNCDENFLFFGTNTGWIYCFSRGERQAKGPMYEHHPVNCQIIGIQIPDENVVALLLPHGFILFNFVQNEVIYSWSFQRFDCQQPPDNYPFMVTSKCIYDESRHRYNVFTGDSIGTVRCHNVIEDETVTIFNEENDRPMENVNRDDNPDGSQSKHYHQIVQIDVYSPDLLLVSTCFRSVILWKSISDSWTTIQVGRNIRKVCGQYGAIFHREGNVILASRPSMHLIKANTTDGSVVETYKLKSAKPLKNLNLFREVNKPGERKPSVLPIDQQDTSNVFNLGFLVPLQINNEDYICSWNSHSLFIIKLDGTLLVKEYSSIKIIAVNVSYCKGFRDVIILREDWTLFRIRFIVKNYKERTSDYGIGEVLRGTLGNQNLLNLPSQAYNSLEGEIKKIYSIMQDKIYEGGEKLLTYTSFDSLNVLRRNSSMENHLNQKNDASELPSLDQPSDYDNNENLSPPTSPLYIHQRILRKNSANSKAVTESDKSEEDVLFAVNQTRSSNSFDFDSTRSNLSNSNPIKAPGSDENDATFLNSDIGIADINEIIVENMEPQKCAGDNEYMKDETPSQSKNSINLDGLELVRKFHEYSSPNYASDVKSTMIRDGENIFNNIEFLEKDKTLDYIPSIIDERLQLSNSSRSKSRGSSIDDRVQSYEYTEESIPLESSEIVCLPIQEERPVKHVEWQLAIESTHNSGQSVKYFCASAYSDLESNSYVWLFCVSKKRPKLVYYPDFESLRLPPGNNKRFIIGAIRNKIYLFNEDNELWSREGVDESGLAIVPLALGALGALSTLSTKWTNVALPKLPSVQFTNLSLCSSDYVGWLSDVNGDVWLTKLQTNTWTKIPHDPDNKFHVKEVQVCPVDSSLVWCIDSLNRLFVRAGIFNTRGDEDEHIGGMAWLPVHAPMEVKSLAVTSKSVWILSKQGNRLFKRIGIQPPSSYVGTDWQEIKSPTLLKDSLKAISASLNDDVWLLTELGSIWQVCDP